MKNFYKINIWIFCLNFNFLVLNLGSLLGYGNTGYYPNYNRPGYYPNYNYNTGYYPSVGKYPSTGTYYPNNNYYPPSGPGTNILGGGGGYGGYGGYGGNGGLQQYYGYWNPSYTGQRNLGYGYYSNTDQYGLPKYTTNSQYYRGYA